MKSFFAYIFIAIVIVGVFAPTKLTLAADPISSSAALGARIGLSAYAGDCQTDPDPTDSIMCFIGWLGYILLKLAAWLLEIAGWLLNYSIKWTIVDWAKNVGQMTGINIAWKFIRDLMNICFIFFLVYYSIKLIIGQETRQHIYKFIGMIVLVSLLINFSLFITKVIIDASNVATIGMYQTILGGQKDPDVGLSDAYQQNLGLTNFYGASGFKSFSDANGSSGQKMFFIGLIGSVLFVITAFVFFAVFIMFLIRYLVLIFLLMFAAVGFMGMVVPGMKKYANEWWDTLIGQCLFGPIYMIITWVILTLIASPGFITKNGAAASWVQLILDPNPKVAAGNQSPIELLINFALIIGLTVMALTVSKSASQRGSTMVSKFGGKLTAFAGGAVLGGSAVALRQTVGRAADRVSKTKWLQDKASGRTSSAATRWMYSGMYSGSQKAAKGSFDARNTAVGEQISKGLGTGVGINLGQGLPWNKNAGQGGIRKSQEEKRQKIIERGKVFTDREARATYAQRQASGLLTKGGSSSNKRSLFGMIGSPHRQAAATLLNERVTELQSNINQARGELNTLHRTMGFVPAPGAMIAPAAYTTTLSPAEQARYATLTGLATTPGSIASMSAEFVSTRDLINNPTSAGGLDLRNTIKQGF